LGWNGGLPEHRAFNWESTRRFFFVFTIYGAEHRSRSHDAVIRVYDVAGNMIDTHEHKGDFKDW
jgi:hypothetical protein